MNSVHLRKQPVLDGSKVYLLCFKTNGGKLAMKLNNQMRNVTIQATFIVKRLLAATFELITSALSRDIARTVNILANPVIVDMNPKD